MLLLVWFCAIVEKFALGPSQFMLVEALGGVEKVFG